jgi:hypothetical protein
MDYESHGTGQPLALLHGAFSAIGNSFGECGPELAKTRQVVSHVQKFGSAVEVAASKSYINNSCLLSKQKGVFTDD